MTNDRLKTEQWLHCRNVEYWFEAYGLSEEILFDKKFVSKDDTDMFMITMDTTVPRAAISNKCRTLMEGYMIFSQQEA